jgi:uncharacterized protein YecE (DUF72 family)
VIRVGTAGWSYADWEGPVYPRHKPSGFHPLRHLSSFLQCVEVNSTFYAPPRREHARHWAELLSDRPDFRLTVKLHQEFTHAPMFGADGLAPSHAELEARAKEFLDGIEPLRRAHKLGALLLQFPIGFHHDEHAFRRLGTLHALFGAVPLVLELRHRSWFEPPVLGAIEGLGYSLAEIDMPDAWNHPPPGHPTPGPLGYLRLHGRNRAAWFDRRAGRDQKYDYLYPPEEVSELVKRAKRLAGGHDETYVITNNHFGGKAVANAVEILHGLSGTPVPAPRELVEHFPRLLRITRRAGQQELFP